MTSAASPCLLGFPTPTASARAAWACASASSGEPSAGNTHPRPSRASTSWCQSPTSTAMSRHCSNDRTDAFRSPW